LERPFDESNPACGKVCFVTYRRGGSESAPPANERIVLIAILEKVDLLSLFVDPMWRNFIFPEHVEYIELLLEDLVPRSHSDPCGLFAQLSSLNVGPLVTTEMKTFEDLYKVQSAIPSHFRQLE